MSREERESNAIAMVKVGQRRTLQTEGRRVSVAGIAGREKGDEAGMEGLD